MKTDTAATTPTALPLEVYELSRAMRHTLNRATRDLGFTQEQWRALWHLSRNEGLTQTNLASLLEIQPISLTRVLDRLSAQGLIERRTAPNDRRAMQVFLTDAAQPVIAALGEILNDFKTTVVAGLSPADQTKAADVLRHMRANLDKSDATTSAA